MQGGAIGQPRAAQPVKQPKSKHHDDNAVGVVAGSMALAIPLLAIAAAGAGSVGVVAVLICVLLVNVVYFASRA
jgi:hypothetical protein